jgi:alpha-aminoadipic semialdehyde synthase
VIFAVKEIPIQLFQPGKTYVFFSHVIKGQHHNMPMLRKMMELGCTLIEYEKITNEKNRRLVFFGHYAGLAGMIDTLWAFGQRLKNKGVKSPFSEIKQTTHYKNLDDAKDHFKKIGEKIKQDGISDTISPVVIGITGYGNVSKGAQEILDVLPVEKINPNQLKNIKEKYSNKLIYKVVFKEEDLVEPISKDTVFDLQDYYHNPQNYKSIFTKHVPYLSILMNCIYWDERYPRLITKKFLKNNFEKLKLQIVGDISVDVNGAVEFTEKVTTPDNPVFVYNPHKDEILDGYQHDGVAVMAVDNLPCELPRESSKEFSYALIPFIPAIVKADYSVDFEQLNLPIEIKKAVILHKGKLTPDYQYINKFL